METRFTGTAYRFGNNIDTDQIYPGKYLDLTDPREIASHCLEGADAEFAKRVRAGDIVTAGTNFGCGSSREHAAIALKYAGVAAILAKSFARIFYRNAINLGLPAIVCPRIDEVSPAGTCRLTVDLEQGIVTNEETGVSVPCEAVSGYSLKILQSGGIKPLIRKQLAADA